ncbi:MAG: DUF3078 domain-containing protein [Paludibacter sp.]|nr:DUF3078 domain-containing protein [Paludibacter sp.]MDD4198506.1 DUF3078 domain-containing protein [Paludibacter sp.]
MKLKVIVAIFSCVFISVPVFPFAEINRDSITVTQIKNLIENSLNVHDSVITIPEEPATRINATVTETDSFVKKGEKEYVPIDIQQILANVEHHRIKSLHVNINDRFLGTNPFFIDLLFYGYSANPVKVESCSVVDYIEKMSDSKLKGYNLPESGMYAAEKVLQELREATVRKIAAHDPYLIAYKIDNLPDVSDLINFQLNIRPIDETVLMTRHRLNYDHQRMTLEKIKRNPWATKSYAMLQFSQNYISSNWYQGGSDNISILGIVNGNFNYDNKKNIQWDNFVEWRMGFNSVEGDTLRFLNTNDDILRTTSKLGIKAGGNFFYSASVDFSTHFFNSYKAVNSTIMKAKFLTPVRFNVNVGLDYKYKKLLSLMVSPLSYKFIYANDTILVNQKSFGIQTGDNILSQIGSSFRAQLSYSPRRDLQIDSKLSFYTNYEKIEVDWEIVGNFKFNRFLSTRLSLNPRYDNTVISNERARIQFKQLLTFGLSYKLL